MKRSEELAECMGNEAVEALKNGTEWEYQPETIEAGNWNPYWCDDCETWHQEWYMFGYRIEDGHMYEVIHSCDTDGNWEVDDEYDVDDVDYERWNAQYGYEETEKASKAYSAWVAENGEDPLGNYFVQSTVRQRYQVVIQRRGVASGRFHFLKAKPVDSKDWNSNAEELPERLRDFLQLEGDTLMDIDDLGWNDCNDFAQHAHVHEVVRHDSDECEFIEEIEVARPHDEYVADLIAAAKCHI